MGICSSAVVEQKAPVLPSGSKDGPTSEQERPRRKKKPPLARRGSESLASAALDDRVAAALRHRLEVGSEKRASWTKIILNFSKINRSFRQACSAPAQRSRGRRTGRALPSRAPSCQARCTAQSLAVPRPARPVRPGTHSASEGAEFAVCDRGRPPHRGAALPSPTGGAMLLLSARCPPGVQIHAVFREKETLAALDFPFICGPEL